MRLENIERRWQEFIIRGGKRGVITHAFLISCILERQALVASFLQFVRRDSLTNSHITYSKVFIMPYRTITDFSIEWDLDHDRGRVTFNLNNDPRPEVRFDLPSLAHASSLAALLGAGSKHEWDGGSRTLKVSR